MQKVMQENCAVYRTGETLEEGSQKLHKVWGRTTRSASPTAR